MTDRLPADLCERIFAGETPLQVWTDYRGMDISQLRTASNVGGERLEKLLAGKGRQMTEKEERALSRALNVPRVNLRPMSFAGCSGVLADDEG